MMYSFVSFHSYFIFFLSTIIKYQTDSIEQMRKAIQARTADLGIEKSKVHNRLSCVKSLKRARGISHPEIFCVISGRRPAS